MAKSKIKCTKCHEELSQEDFYPSCLKRHLYICKKCHNKIVKKHTERYLDSVRNLPTEDFNRMYGGFNVKILNYVREGEKRYVIIPTKGKLLSTNDKEEFIQQIKEILANYP